MKKRPPFCRVKSWQKKRKRERQLKMMERIISAWTDWIHSVGGESFVSRCPTVIIIIIIIRSMHTGTRRWVQAGWLCDGSITVMEGVCLLKAAAPQPDRWRLLLLLLLPEAVNQSDVLVLVRPLLGPTPCFSSTTLPGIPGFPGSVYFLFQSHWRRPAASRVSQEHTPSG